MTSTADMKFYKPEGLEEVMDVKGDFKSNKNHNNEAGEMNQQLRPLAIPAEDLGSGSSSSELLSRFCNCSSVGSHIFFWPL